MNLRRRLGIEWLIIGLIASLLVFFANRWEGTSSFDNLFYDQLSSISRPAADPDILLVNIDDRSLAEIGKWPWPRTVHAQMIERLQKAEPRSITLDVILSEPGNADGDAALAAAMKGPAPVIMPLHFISPGSDGRAYDVVPPAPAFADAASRIGHVNLEFDSDGVVRRTQLCFDPEGNGNSWPHMMEQVYRVTRNDPSRPYRAVRCGKTLLIPYAARGSHREVSYSDLLNNELPADMIQGRDVIIGASATGLGDAYPVPFGDGGILAGSEIMANALRAIKDDSFILITPKITTDLLSLLPMWLLLIGFLRWLPRTALLASLSMLVLLLAAVAIALRSGIWFPPGAAVLGILLVYPLWGWRRLQAMSDFMSSELLELEREGETVPIPVRQANAADLVGRQSASLASAIDHMRDLRRFVSDAMSDLPDPMVVTDLNARVTMTSDLVEKRLGQSIIGYILDDVMARVVIPEHRDMVLKYLQSHDAKKAKQRVTEAEGPAPITTEFVRFQTTDGGTFVMRESLVQNASGAHLGYIYYLADITALATAEAERERLLQLLSHDMRAPQSAIIASLEGTMDDGAKKRIERNARLTMQLAQDFVEMARMGETEFAGEDVILLDLIRDVADNYWPLAKERGITINITDNSDSGFILAEAQGLSRAFANLIDNAIKFSPDNSSITVTIDRIKLESGPFLSVTVADQGDGIAPEILPHLFQRFATGGNQRGRSKGTGLGLTYVLAVTERHGGTVEGGNNEAAGAYFTVQLPESLEE
ncbi:CHASE2 domain-containing protein [Sphingorhabdus arenilitoris]|uniref:histidine kinase n=1 Tax=Sphingorhabdus arenilitoris TaxID=1490041 RepID=A0ABV8RBT1_9SPHN